MNDFVEPDDLRTIFALSMSAMYKSEVPLYGDLVDIVKYVNGEVLSQAKDMSPCNGDENIEDLVALASAERLDLERHGAIRVGTPEELRMIRRIFRVLGMYPVGYYDLSVAGLPMHATCFRPITRSSLAKNPFRVFTTLLRPELVGSEEARELAMTLLQRRNIFTSNLREILDLVEKQQNGKIRKSQVETFVKESMKTFGWQQTAAATHAQYNLLKSEHPVLADIACFNTVHINHLTPRTLNIDKAQIAMGKAGMAVKSRIEGPPKRLCPILLRQTSFLALNEPIRFQGDGSGETVEGSHTARFGEIEERGIALTSKGRLLYDKLLNEGLSNSSAPGDVGSAKEIDEAVAKSFQRFPDTREELRLEHLAFFEYLCPDEIPKDRLLPILHTSTSSSSILSRFISEGIITTKPITYEDFLPLSAAGIFQSNLNGSPTGSKSSKAATMRGDREGFESALRAPLLKADELYREIERNSLKRCAKVLGFDEQLFSM